MYVIGPWSNNIIQNPYISKKVIAYRLHPSDKRNRIFNHEIRKFDIFLKKNSCYGNGAFYMKTYESFIVAKLMYLLETYPTKNILIDYHLLTWDLFEGKDRKYNIHGIF